MTTKIALTNIADTALATLTGPKITTIVYPGDDTATDIAGGQTINLTGAGFQSGCSVLVASTASSVVSFVSATQISFTAPALAAGTYVIYVINPDGGTAISIPGISYSGTPNWTTPAGTLGTAYETGAISATLTATGDAPITYTLATGTLPPGSTLNSNGTLSGTAQATASATTYSFTIKASDAQNQDTNRAFSITINPDAVTFNTPTDSTTYNVFKDALIANVAMSATSAAGGSITYTADTLPTGLSISGANIQGTPTVVASTTTVLTATATSTRSATRTINWVVSISNDTFFKNTTLLLNGETSVTPFISDASTNNFGLVINGDTKANKFSPYYGDGYYSNYFDGTGDYVTTPSDTAFAFGTGDFTMECWIYPMSTLTAMRVFEMVGGDNIDLNLASTGTISYYNGSTSTTSAAGLVNINNWYHIALVRSSGTAKVYVNGVLAVTQATTPNTTTARVLNIGGVTNILFVGYISNVRVVKGTAVYTAAFIPSTTPLTAITNTVLLTCQSNRFIDKSTNNFTITKNGDTLVSPMIPFNANSSYSAYGSAYFDGNGDYLSIPQNTSFNLGTGDFTIECWIYISNTTNVDQTIISNNIASFSAGAVIFKGYQSGNISFQAYDFNTGGTALVSTTAILSQWVHVALTRVGNLFTIYKNGVSAASASWTGSVNFSTVNTLIGYSGTYNTALTGYHTGYIAELRVVKGTGVYTTAFTPTTTPLTAITNTSLLTLQYNGGANNSGFIDNSNFNNVVTRVGNTSQGTFSPYSQTGWSNYIGTTAMGLQTPANSQTNIIGTSTLSTSSTFTIECWIYHLARNAAGGGGNLGLVVGSMNTAGAQADWGFGPDPTGKLTVWWWNGSAIVAGFTTNSVQLNTWTHITLVVVNGAFTIFINGIQETLTGTTTVTSVSSSQSFISIGGYTESGTTWRGFNGYISNLRIVKSRLYTTNFTPDTTPLTAIANTSLLICQSNRFVDNSLNSYALTVINAPSVQAYSPFGSIREATPLSYSSYFDGTGDYLTFTGSTTGSGNFTVEAWINLSILRDYQVIFDNRATAATTTGFAFGVTSTGAPYLYTNNAFLITGTVLVIANVWTHIALVRSSTTITLYVNGVSSGTGTSAANFSDTNNGIGIAPTYTPTSQFYGYISNLRIVNGTAFYTTTFTPSTTPLTSITNTSLLTCQSTTMIDNSTNKFTLTANGDVKPRQFNPFGYTAQSSASYTPSIHGGSAYFDGTGDYLRLSNSSLAVITADFTIEGWVYLTALNTGKNVYALGTETSGRIAFYVNTSGQLGIARYGVGTDITFTGASTTVNQWAHFAFVRAGSTINAFLNGTLAGTVTLSGSLGTGTQVSVFTSAATDAYSTGYLSDMRITYSALYTSSFIPPTQTLTSSTTTPASLLLNFTNGGIIDQHSGNVLETVSNAQLSTSVKKFGNSSMYFDGAGDYLNIPAGNPPLQLVTGDFTVEFWMYGNSVATACSIVDNRNPDTANIAFDISLSSSVLRFTTSGTAFITGTTTLINGIWYHIALTRSGNTFKLFLNGTQEGTTYTGSTTQNFTNSNFRIGSGANGAFNGYIDDFRITRGYARYTSNFTAPTSALITK